MDSYDQALADIAAIVSPDDFSAASDFETLRDRIIVPHIKAKARQANGHRDAAKEIRQRMDAAQQVLDHWATVPAPSTPAGIRVKEQEVKRASQQKWAYSALLDALKRSCGKTCCPDEAIEHPDPRF